MERTNKGLVATVVVLVILVLGLGGYIVYDKMVVEEKDTSSEKENKNEKVDEKENQNEKVDENQNSTIKYKDSTGIDYDKLEEELKGKVHSNQDTNAYLSTCEDFKAKNQKISVNSISEVIKKLKTAVSVEEVPTSTFCPEYTFSVTSNIEDDNRENIMLVYYANDKKVLLVGIHDTGYAYHFATEKELDHFLENLK